jgi:hypothetical protein
VNQTLIGAVVVAAAATVFASASDAELIKYTFHSDPLQNGPYDTLTGFVVVDADTIVSALPALSPQLYVPKLADFWFQYGHYSGRWDILTFAPPTYQCGADPFTCGPVYNFVLNPDRTISTISFDLEQHDCVSYGTTSTACGTKPPWLGIAGKFDYLVSPQTQGAFLRGYGSWSGPEVVPEPTTIALLGLGLVGLTVARRRTNRPFG